MKKLFFIVLTIFIFMSLTAKESHALGLAAQFSPSFGMQTKLNDFGSTLNYRDVNPALNFAGDIILCKGLGAGIDILYYLGDWSVRNISGDVDYLGVTFGPSYYYDLPILPIFFHTALRIGYYNSDVSTTLAGVNLSADQNSFGFNWSFGVGVKILKLLTVGGKFAIHYISNTGSSDDAILFTVGPNIGVKF